MRCCIIHIPTCAALLVRSAAIGSSQRAECRIRADKIFNGKVFNDMVKNNTIDKPVNNPSMFNTDAGLINEYVVEAQYMKNANRVNVKTAEELRDQATRLIELIKQYVAE
jgi:phosphoribosylaminoimidazole-succinocarboxamide synthase